MFKISGVKVDQISEQNDAESNNEIPDDLEFPELSDANASSCLSPSRILELKLMDAEQQRTPSESSDGSSSQSDTETMIDASDFNLDLDDIEVEVDVEKGEKIITYFNLTIHDMDTGLNYEVPFVKCTQIRQNKHKKSREDSCKLSSNMVPSDKFKFVSTKRIHGDRATLTLHKQFGPGFGKDFEKVFKGEMAFKYKYPVCYPKTDVNQTKWCL